jgi:hypothetical protein
MTEKRSTPTNAGTLLAKMGGFLVVAWIVGVLAVYYQLLFARILSMAGALP